jgi:uncharacterized short protein YbdD (DUF466 family)
MLEKLKRFWQTIRSLSGDDAYEKYLKHYAEVHAGLEEPSEGLPKPLSREDFFKEWQDKKWKGVKRCC